MKRQTNLRGFLFALCLILAMAIPALAGTRLTEERSFGDETNLYYGPYAVTVSGDLAEIAVLGTTSGDLDQAVLYGSDGTLRETLAADGLYYPYGIAYDDSGNLWVADSGNDRVLKTDREGNVLIEITSADGTGLSDPRGVAVDLEYGDVYVTDTGNDRVLRFEADGTFATDLGAEEDPVTFDMPWSIAVDSHGTVWVCDVNNFRVVNLRYNGELYDSWGEQGSGEGQIDNYTSSSSGKTYHWGMGIAVDDLDRVCVADGGNQRFHLFKADGTFLCDWSIGNSDSTPSGVASAGTDSFVVTDSGTYTVHVLKTETFSDYSGGKVMVAGATGFGDAGQDLVDAFDAALSADLGDELLLIVPSSMAEDENVATLRTLLDGTGKTVTEVTAEDAAGTDLDGKSGTWIVEGPSDVMETLFGTLSADLKTLYDRDGVIAATGLAGAWLGDSIVDPLSGDAALLNPEELTFTNGLGLLTGTRPAGAMIVPCAREEGYVALAVTAASSKDKTVFSPDSRSALLFEGETVTVIGRDGAYVLRAPQTPAMSAAVRGSRSRDSLVAQTKEDSPSLTSNVIISYLGTGDRYDMTDGTFEAATGKTDIFDDPYYWLSEQQQSTSVFEAGQVYRTITEDLVDNEATSAYAFSLDNISDEGAEGLFVTFAEKDDTAGYWLRDNDRNVAVYSAFNVSADIAPVQLAFTDVAVALPDGSSGGCSMTGVLPMTSLIVIPLLLLMTRKP